MKKPKKKPFDNEENARLFVEYSKTKELKTRNELVKLNQPLVTSIVTKYYTSPTITADIREELIQEGTMGLMSAIDGFDHSLGWKFSTYAYWWVRQAINNYLVSSCPTIKIPGHIRIAQNRLLKKLKRDGRALDFADIDFKEFDISQKTLNSIKSASEARRVISANLPVSFDKSGDGSFTRTIQDTLQEDNNLSPETNLDNRAMVSAVKEALRLMPPKRRTILLLRYGVIKEKDVTYSDD